MKKSFALLLAGAAVMTVLVVGTVIAAEITEHGWTYVGTSDWDQDGNYDMMMRYVPTSDANGSFANGGFQIWYGADNSTNASALKYTDWVKWSPGFAGGPLDIVAGQNLRFLNPDNWAVATVEDRWNFNDTTNSSSIGPDGRKDLLLSRLIFGGAASVRWFVMGGANGNVIHEQHIVGGAAEANIFNANSANTNPGVNATVY